MNTRKLIQSTRKAAAAGLTAALLFGPGSPAELWAAIAAKAVVKAAPGTIAGVPGAARLGGGSGNTLARGATLRLDQGGVRTVQSLRPSAAGAALAVSAADPTLPAAAALGRTVRIDSAHSAIPAPLALPPSSLAKDEDFEAAPAAGASARADEKQGRAFHKELGRLRSTVSALPKAAEGSPAGAWGAGEQLHALMTHGIARSAAELVQARFGVRSPSALKPALAAADSARNDEAARHFERVELADAADPALQAEVETTRAAIARLKEEVAKVMVGQEDMIDSVIVAMIAGEHVLIEGVPGIAKTTLVETIAAATGAKFQIIQMTPDLLPKGITGGMVLEEDPATGKKQWVLDKGPIFDAQILLADEINRATPKTQAALLQPMQHRKVTIKRQTFELEKPFLVLATQNPIEQEGTNYLPEAQQDRFMYKIAVNESTDAEFLEIVERFRRKAKPKAEKVVALEELMGATGVAERIRMDDKLMEYVLNIRNAVKDPARYGIGEPGWVREAMTQRMGIFMAKAARIHALMDGRSWVTVEDIRAIAPKLLRHRVILGDAIPQGMTTDSLIAEILAKVPASRAEFQKLEQVQADKKAVEIRREERRARWEKWGRPAVRWAFWLGVPLVAFGAAWFYWADLVQKFPFLQSALNYLK